MSALFAICVHLCRCRFQANPKSSVRWVAHSGMDFSQGLECSRAGAKKKTLARLSRAGNRTLGDTFPQDFCRAPVRALAWDVAGITSMKAAGKRADHGIEHTWSHSWINPLCKRKPMRNQRMKSKAVNRLPKSICSFLKWYAWSTDKRFDGPLWKAWPTKMDTLRLNWSEFNKISHFLHH